VKKKGTTYYPMYTEEVNMGVNAGQKIITLVIIMILISVI